MNTEEADGPNVWSFTFYCICSILGAYFMLTGTKASEIIELGIIFLVIGAVWEYIFKNEPLIFRRSIVYVAFATFILGLMLYVIGKYLTGMVLGVMIVKKRN